MNLKLFNLYILLAYFATTSSQRIRIPQNLINCYRGNMTDNYYPNSLQALIDIIRKIESTFPTSIDLRHLSSRLFHDLRIDGIQRSLSAIETEDITPYAVTGFMTHKNQILRQIVSNVSGIELKYEEILTLPELCTLHKLLSSSIEPYERQNELLTCPWKILNTTADQSIFKTKMPGKFLPHERSFNNHTIIAPNFSRCPIELGCVFNDYGAIHAGIIIANVVSGLMPQNVRINDFVSEYREKDPYENLETMEETDNKQKIGKVISSLSSVDNTYASGLAGDLAEMVLFQGPIVRSNFSVGFPALWNDTSFPRLLHLNGSRSGFFHFTDSEVLSGLDGLFISQQVSAWTSRIMRLRLSQIFDMFYLHQGISIPSIQATNNRKNFFKGRPTQKSNRKNNDDGEAIEEVTFHPRPFDGRTLFKKAFNYKMLNEEIIDTDVNYLSRFTIAEGINSVCHRRKIIEMIDIERLKEETYNFIQILEFSTRTPTISIELLKQLSNSAVDQFIDYATKLVEKTTNCNESPIDIEKTAVDMTLVIDGSRTHYQNLQLINFVAQLIGVSKFGSYISVVHGNSGRFLVNRTNSVINAFEQLRNFSATDNPTRLSLSNVFRSIMFQLTNQTLEEKEAGVYMALPKVVLVVSQSHRISQLDYEGAQRVLLSSMLQFPDLYFVFLSNDISTLKDMIAGKEQSPTATSRMLIETADRYKFIDERSVNVASFERELKAALKNIPKRIISPFCSSADEKSSSLTREEFEDYATPNVLTKYRISPFYLVGSDEVKMRFQGVGYGDLTVCMSRNIDMMDKICENIEDIENVWFNITEPCSNPTIDQCSSIYFTVTVDTSYIRCTEYTCRFPDDVRFNIRPEGLRCERNSSRRIFSLPFNFLFLFIIFYSLLLV